MRTDSRHAQVARVARVLALSLGVAAGCTRTAAEPVSSLQTSNVIKGALRITAEASGSVEPIRKVEVKSKASGEILALSVDVGDLVQTGALLARIDPRDVKNSDEQAAADLEVARARLEISNAQNRRSKELLEGGVITTQEYDNSRLDLANAQAGLIKAQTNKSLSELRLGDVTISAPLSGTIIQKSVEEGQVIQSASQNVSGGTTLFVMANLLEMQVRTLVDETDMGQIRAGMQAVVKVEAFPDRPFQGYVEKVEPQGVVQQSVTMFPVIVRLDNHEGMLRPGMNADVEILIDEAADILLVPNNAIVLPQDVQPAAIVLGLDPAAFDMAALGVRGGRGGQGGGAGRGTGGGAGGAGFDLPRGSGVVTTQAAPAGGRQRQIRRAVVFVVNAQGTPEPRAVQIGLNDYDHTEVVSGLVEGDQVALLGAAELQAQQQQFLDRVRQGGGGNPFGGGGFIPGGGGGGRPRGP